MYKRQHIVCGRSDFHGCLRRQPHGNPHDSGKADPSEGGDPDCLKALSGKDRPVFLSEKMPKAAERSAEAIKEAVDVYKRQCLHSSIS